MKRPLYKQQQLKRRHYLTEQPSLKRQDWPRHLRQQRYLHRRHRPQYNRQHFLTPQHRRLSPIKRLRLQPCKRPHNNKLHRPPLVRTLRSMQSAQVRRL